MNKKELISKVRENVEYSKTEIETVATAIFDTIIDTVASGESVRIPGFGIFESRDRKSRQGRNPSTGEIIQIPASKNVKFKPSKNFSDEVKK